MLTVYGVVALTFMMLMYAFEHRDRRFILASIHVRPAVRLGAGT